MWELDADCGSGEMNPSLWKQKLQEDACHIIHRTQDERICIATGQYPHRTSGTFIVNQQGLQVIMVRPCLPSRYTARNHNSYYREQSMIVVADEDCINHGGTSSKHGHASRCCHCCASQTAQVDGRPLHGWRRLLEYPNDALASRVLLLYYFKRIS